MIIFCCGVVLRSRKDHKVEKMTHNSLNNRRIFAKSLSVRKKVVFMISFPCLSPLLGRRASKLWPKWLVRTSGQHKKARRDDIDYIGTLCC